MTTGPDAFSTINQQGRDYITAVSPHGWGYIAPVSPLTKVTGYTSTSFFTRLVTDSFLTRAGWTRLSAMSSTNHHTKGLLLHVGFKPLTLGLQHKSGGLLSKLNSWRYIQLLWPSFVSVSVAPRISAGACPSTSRSASATSGTAGSRVLEYSALQPPSHKVCL